MCSDAAAKTVRFQEPIDQPSALHEPKIKNTRIDRYLVATIGHAQLQLIKGLDMYDEIAEVLCRGKDEETAAIIFEDEDPAVMSMEE